MKRLFVMSLCIPLVLTACGKGKVKTDPVIGKEVLNTVMPTGPVRHPQHGLETWFAVGAVKGEKKTNANGVVQVHVFEDKNSIVDVRLNIEKAPKGKQYGVWVELADQSKVRVGELASILGDVRHAVNATVPQDLTGAMAVVVTLEAQGAPNPSAASIATGPLKERKR